MPWRRTRELTLHLLERASIALLVAAGIFQLATGVANSAQFYPWSFSFRATHYAVAWVAFGALVLHVAVKLPVIRSALTRPLDDGERPGSGLTRRGLVRVGARCLGGGRALRRGRHRPVAAPGCRCSRPTTGPARRTCRSTRAPGGPTS